MTEEKESLVQKIFRRPEAKYIPLLLMTAMFGILVIMTIFAESRKGHNQSVNTDYWVSFAAAHHCAPYAIREGRTEYQCDQDKRVEFAVIPPAKYLLDQLYK